MQVRAADSAPVQLDLDVVVLVDLALRDVLDADVPRLLPTCSLHTNPSLRGMKATRAPARGGYGGSTSATKPEA